jgi:hypothetical protein
LDVAEAIDDPALRAEINHHTWIGVIALTQAAAGMV